MGATVTVGHPRDLLVWHGVSAACMAVMVAVVLPAWLSAAALGLFAVGLTWCVVQAVRQSARAAYLRLGLCCVAMLTMLVPGPATHAEHAQHAAMGQHAAPLSAGSTSAAADRTLLTGLLAVALIAVAVVGAVHLARAPRDRGSRTVAGCESVLAAAMAAMLLGVL